MPMVPDIKLSVIVPCLNEEKTLPFFLDSLCHQSVWIYLGGCSHQPNYQRTLFPFELIIIDGGSTDNSLSLIDSYRHRLHITGIIDKIRNLGLVRNRGAILAKSEILFFTNSDTVLPINILPRIYHEFKREPEMIALSGRTIPMNGGTICTAAYIAFDCLRGLFSRIGKFSPSGNLLAIRTPVFHAIGGFHALRVNEDGELGNRLNDYARDTKTKNEFKFNFHVWHYAKRFRKNPLCALLFYLYVFGNFSSVLKRILQPVERKSAYEF